MAKKDTPSPNQRKGASYLSLLNQNVETTDKITKAVIDEMDAIIADTKNQKEKMKLEGLVKCGIWDFADITEDLKSFNKDEELVSTKDKAEDLKSGKQDMKFDSIEDYIDFWFDCIHCLCEDDIDHENTLCPPVIMVCTGTDNYKEEAALQFREHKLHLLNVMEKFDIIVQPEFCDIDNNKRHKSHSYYLPCMIEKSVPFDTIKKMFIQENDQVTTTPWLVLEFKFPPGLFQSHF
ncbi:unnamed protein product [Mytilus edulis]|uniref:Uncharacterized protein n=1 Tax=Mytilus edulis TaxID=6550 RepID=A0A8S3REY6_MYTED|nr:unnamed protein product [Mytilus edulis]